MSDATLTFYDVRCDVNNFQYLLIEKSFAQRYGYPSFDGTPMDDRWLSPDVYVFQPRLKDGAFWSFALKRGCFAIRQDILNSTDAGAFLEEAGELLPVAYDNREFKVLNITACFDMLDHARTEFKYYDDGTVADVERPVFRSERIGSQLFKVPETSRDRIYYWEHSGLAEQQFRRYCHEHGLHGLIFEELYTVTAMW